MFSDFVSNYQTCPTEFSINTPFVFVTPEGDFKLITNVVNSIGSDEEIFALSVAEDGFMEFLALQEG